MTLEPFVRCTWLAAATLAVSADPSLAQRVPQNVTFQTGWNSAYLEVAPEPSDLDLSFAGPPIEAIWCQRNRSVLGRAAAGNGGRMDDWQVWIPSGAPASVVNSPRMIRGGNVYFVSPHRQLRAREGANR